MFLVTCWAVSKCHGQDTVATFNTYVPTYADSVIYSDKDQRVYFTDKYGKWLIWKYGSDTLELIPPKIRFIKIGKKIIKLDAQ